ncbi:MAG: aminotransferase class IV [Clostridia bacterium]|nr:aminotransferase class IV [Clostridia bacterium]
MGDRFSNIKAVDSIPVDDMGFSFGFNLFETFLVSNSGKVFLLDRHIDRLFDSIKFFEFDIDFGKDELSSVIVSYIEQNKVRDKILRVSVTAGNKMKGLKSAVAITCRNNTYKPEDYVKGCRLTMAGFGKNEESPIVSHKTGNYLENYLALKQANSNGYDDALFLNTEGFISETAKCNLFFVKDNILYTPDVSCGLLPGVVRQWVIESSESMGIQCLQGNYATEPLVNADEVFVTNSAVGIMHVSSVDECSIKDGTVGKITKLIINKYKNVFD